MLSRPLDQRIREHKYRWPAKSLVFGLPVIGLQYFGDNLAAPSPRTGITIMQIVLTGWILYVAATGMITEGMMLLVSRRRSTRILLSRSSPPRCLSSAVSAGGCFTS